MNKLLSKLINIKINIIEFITVRTFLLCTKKRQDYLIDKNGCMFLGLQNFSRKLDEDGDTMGAMIVSSESLHYVYNFSLYCEAKGIDASKRIVLYERKLT